MAATPPPAGDPRRAPRDRGAPRGRGAATNPDNRFERLRIAEEPDGASPDDDPPPPVRTRFFRDPARRIFSTNESPDLFFSVSLNPYRGCEHGCVYCYARPTHEYLGFSAGLDFESRILVREDAPAMVRRALASRSWKPQPVAIGGVTDAYQPVERRLGLTRRCLEVFAEFRNPVALVTKSALIARDADILAELARHDAVIVYVTVTTLDRELARTLEPRAPAPARRLAAVEALARAGIPVGVMVAPVIPGLTEHEAPRIVEAAAAAGARFAPHLMLRLPHGVKGLLEDWLDRHVPDRKQKVWNRIRDMRGGRLNDTAFHTRMRGRGEHAEQIHALFDLACRRAGLTEARPPLSTAAFRRPGGAQIPLFPG